MPVTPQPDPLPIGTVTFLFTDIEGSTRLWEKQHAAMQLALAQHDAILRKAIATNNGYLFKATGDGVHAAFAVAADAMAACLTAQRALNTQGWGEVRIKSRMALHSGVAEQRDGDYFGPTLNRVARLMAAAHGGQILLSLATEELVRDQLPANVALRDMGERRLKDLIRPERVYQVIASDLPCDFPPLQTLDARPNNLPAQTTLFVGREREIHAIKEQLSNPSVRLLTLSGIGGTGKTRLALQAAADMVDDFEHGVFFVPLAALSDAGLVLEAIAQACGVREAAGRLKEQLQDHLKAKQILLVLDNFEQVIDAAPLVSELLTAAPRLKALVTSREVLRLYGESAYPVPPLSVPEPKRMPPLERLVQYEAVALFIDRALAVAPAFTVTNENAPAVAEICYRLEGLPLAIELTAAWVRVLPPQRMLAELSRRLSFVQSRARDLPARQKTLRGAIDWSHDLLTDEEQKLFRRLAVFAGGCTLEAIESICSLEGDLHVLETTESLLGKSLLRQLEASGEARFMMLETIREYGGERLCTAGETERLSERHANYFISLAEDITPKLKGAEQGAWFARLEEDHNNFRSALDWSLETGSVRSLRLCGELAGPWEIMGHVSEARAWCERALASVGGAERTPEHAKLLQSTGQLAYQQGDYSAAQELCERALVMSRELAMPTDIAKSLMHLGMVAYDRREFVTAETLYDESLAIWRKLGDQHAIAKMLTNLGGVAYSLGKHQAAKALYEEAVAISRQLGDRRVVAYSLVNLSILFEDQNDHSTARALCEEALAIFREVGERRGVAASLNFLGGIASNQCDYSTAGELYAESLAIMHEIGHRLGVADLLEARAHVMAALGSTLRAARIWGAEERLRTEIGSPLLPSNQPNYDQRVAEARAAIGDDAAFDRAWQEGRAMSLERAIEFALEPPNKGSDSRPTLAAAERTQSESSESSEPSS